MCFIAIFASVRKDEDEKKTNFGHSYLGNGLSDFLQIWNVDSPSWRATLQQIWFQSDEVSPRYKCVKMTFSFFLSIYSRCGAPASWAARHTIVCLDQVSIHQSIVHIELCIQKVHNDIVVLVFTEIILFSGKSVVARVDNKRLSDGPSIFHVDCNVVVNSMSKSGRLHQTQEVA